MKTLYRMMTAFAAGLAVLSCTDALYDDAALSLDVAAGGSAVMEGNVVTVKKGEPIEFLLSGNADFVMFYSGEEGAKYVNRDRVSIDIGDIVKSELSFDLVARYGRPAGCLRVLYSTSFPGLALDDFEADSVLVEKHDGWQDLIPAEELPETNGTTLYSCSADLTALTDRQVTIALWYRQQNAAGSPQYEFSDFKVTNTLESGEEMTMYANGFGFTPLNMLNKYDIPSYEELGDDREYGTVSKGTTGLWCFTNDNLQLGNFTINSGWVPTGEQPMMYSWLVSQYVDFSRCSPDEGVKVKDFNMVLGSYSYTYEEIGVYNAVFVATNANMDHTDRMTRSVVINVVE